MAAGPYYLYADDGIWNSKEASLQINVQSYLTQEFKDPLMFPPNGLIKNIYKEGPWDDIFDEGDDNINKSDNLFVTDDVKFNQIFLLADVEVTIYIYVNIQAMGKGDGSVADLDLTDGKGAVYCTGLYISNHQDF